MEGLLVWVCLMFPCEWIQILQCQQGSQQEASIGCLLYGDVGSGHWAVGHLQESSAVKTMIPLQVCKVISMSISECVKPCSRSDLHPLL